MAITIYNALNFSNNITDAFGTTISQQIFKSLLSSDLFIRNIFATGILEYTEKKSYTVKALITIGHRWRQVIEIYTLQGGEWLLVDPVSMLLGEQWRDLKPLGVYDE